MVGEDLVEMLVHVQSSTEGCSMAAASLYTHATMDIAILFMQSHQVTLPERAASRLWVLCII